MIFKPGKTHEVVIESAKLIVYRYSHKTDKTV